MARPDETRRAVRVARHATAFARIQPLAVAALAVGLVVTVATVVRLVLDADRGLDLTDEGLALLGAWNHQPGAAFNGLAGPYLGVPFALLDHGVAAFRVAGVVALLAVGAWLGWSATALVQTAAGAEAGAHEGAHEGARSRLPGIAAAVAGAGCALAYELLYLRAPSYNLLALVAVGLAGVAVLRILGRPGPLRDTGGAGPGGVPGRALTGGLLGLAAFLGFASKVPSGIGIVAVAIVVVGLHSLGTRRLPDRVTLVAAVVTLAALGAAHVAFVASPGATLATLRRAAALLAAIDPRYYRPIAAVDRVVNDAAAIPGVVLGASGGAVALGLVGALPAVRRRLRPESRARLAVAIVLGVGLALFIVVPLKPGPVWRGIGTYALTLLATAAVAATAAAATAPSRRSARTRPAPPSPALSASLGAVALTGLAFAFAIGSNNGLVSQVGAAAVVLFAAAGLAVGAMGSPNVRATSVALVLTLGATASAAAVAAGRSAPYRTPPLDEASVPALAPRLAGLAFDPATAAYWDDLVGRTAAAGWSSGSALLDLTWSPAVAYVLDATVPSTLTVQVGRDATARRSAILGVRLSPGVDWRRAWLVIAPDLPARDPRPVVGTFGARFPDDYTLVARLRVPFRGFVQEVWRPAAR